MSLVNHEEANQIANEFVSSIENLHNEIAFLLKEIKNKDYEVAELESKIYKKTNDIFRRPANTPLTPKEQAAIERTHEAYDRIDKIAEEKVVLAQRLYNLTNKTLGRLDYDLVRIKVTTGDPTSVDPVSTPYARMAAQQQQAILPASSSLDIRAPSETPVPEPILSAAQQKRRRPVANTNTAALSAPVAPVTSSRSRHPAIQPVAAASPAPSRRRETSRMIAPPEPEEIEQDEEMDDGSKADDDDNKPYCYCRQPSHGEMIACDEPGCPTEWFHLSCLGLKHPPKGEFYCSDCQAARKANNVGGRKGRR